MVVQGARIIVQLPSDSAGDRRGKATVPSVQGVLERLMAVVADEDGLKFTAASSGDLERC